MLMAGRVVRTKTEQALVRIARSGAWSGSLTTGCDPVPSFPAVQCARGPCSSDAPPGAIPFHRLFDVGDSLRRHAYAAIAGGMMSTRQNSAKPAGLSQLNLNAAGIDVGAASHFVAVPADRAEHSGTRVCRSFTADLYRLAPSGCRVRRETVVHGGATGVYWIPLFGVPAKNGDGFAVMLVLTPGASRTCPGARPTSLDCQWLQQLHTYGLLSGRSIPARRGDPTQLGLATCASERMLVEYASRTISSICEGG